MKQYRIPFTGLSLGSHDFGFDIDKTFFDCYEYSIVKDGKLKASINLLKQETMLILQFHITGTIALTCDVCLSEIAAKTSINERLIAKLTDEDLAESTEEVLVLPPKAHELDVAPLLYEYINISIPHYVKCSEQGDNITCDPTVRAKLEDLAPRQDGAQNKKENDPRWDALKKIKYN